MNDLMVTEQQSPTLFNQGPKATLAFATEVANVLKHVIDSQRLYTLVQGKPHVRVEGWTTMGSLIGVLPKEVWVKELEDGSYEAMVELVRQSDGRVMGSASAMCGMDERRWTSADRYARRSMAITRATGKAYRLGFGWVMSLAGYEATPSEEMPSSAVEVYEGTGRQKVKVWEALKAAGLQDHATQFVEGFRGCPMSALKEEIHDFMELKNERAHVGGNAEGEANHENPGEAGPGAAETGVQGSRDTGGK